MINLDFVKAGNSVFTVDNGQGKHFTYKVYKKVTDTNTLYFVSVLTTPDTFTYVGTATLDWQVRLTRASSYTSSALCVRVFDFAMRVILGNQPLPNGYRIQHEGKCGKCARPLTDPISIETGLGPICRNKL